MADQAAAALNAGGEIGPATLAALALTQHAKRYTGRVPKDHPGINGTVNRLLKMFPGGGDDNDILNQSECYFPALATILLAEVDSEKYKNEITQLLKSFEDRQRPTGAFTYLGQPATGDTSQTQFAALAMWAAKSHGFNVNVEMGRKTLAWLCQVHGGSGVWRYKYYNNGQVDGDATLSMEAAGLSTVYLLADFLQLYQRRKDLSKSLDGEVGLPKTVSIYVKPLDGDESIQNKSGPLANFDRGLLNSTVAAGNASFSSRFEYATPNGNYNYYYLYALERYGYFREQAEGDTGSGVFRDWYDKGIDFLKSKQSQGGGFSGTGLETNQIATAFALLFMVRSSEIINMPPADSDLLGGQGFQEGATLRDSGNGRMQSVRAEQNLQDLLNMLEDNKQASEAQLAEISQSLKKQIVEFRQKDDRSRGEIKSFLRSMVGAKNYFRRLIAVRFLAGEQDMDNVPALIYALSDPDFRIALEAHNGLRLISRKLDSMKLSDTTLQNATRDPDVIKQSPELENQMRIDFQNMEKRWTDWFLRIRPNAELLNKS